MESSKILLVWTSPISDVVAELFTNVSVKLSELIDCITNSIIATDLFHLIIPLDSLQKLIEDPVYHFPQIQYIDVYFDDLDDPFVKQFCLLVQHDHRIKFHSIQDLPQRVCKIICDNAVAAISDSLCREIVYALSSSIENRIAAKSASMLLRQCKTSKQFPLADVRGFPVKNIAEVHSDFKCSSCQLVFEKLYPLECGHRMCSICVKVRTKCAICSITITPNRISVDDNNRQTTMKDERAVCSDCDWSGSLGVYYQEHFKVKHQHLWTCSVRNSDCSNHAWVLNSEYSTTTLLDGTGIWRISDVDALKKNPEKAIYSSPFYLFPGGYKACLKLYLKGNGHARHTHTSAFLVLMSGGYDEHLRWPFQYQVTFTLLDHVSAKYNVSTSFLPDKTSSSCQRPLNTMNTPHGVINCFSLDSLDKYQHHYVESDTIYIKLQVNFSAEMLLSPLMPGVNESYDDEEKNTT
ncbi:unnamed protein product [Adineta ricciae]|uniref:MATH domain-containing protein n=1 Tax=Adineta ricciae TaxID=249248 RepID=A0A815H5S2_ADIRI|nr:unnamed protein product [Adineta ricciae]